ncbi:MAG: hypothetical protein QOH06_1087 [Acidobacteriota bacterium]|jgi:hypothetical protein|nr:hypothetical protein [Acidobacteriota bacterium]
MRKLPVIAVLLCAFLARPAQSQPTGCDTTQPLPDPYVFILLDISGSMNHAVPCTQAEYDAGQCAYVCSGSQCHTPMQGDHPGSKWFQTRQALYNVLSGIEDVRFGFATFSDQNAQRVKAKHWLYQATTAGPSISGWGTFPAVGAQEVFGTSWPCTSGAGDGCSVSVPADLADSWELTRVRRLPKGGDALTQTVDVYVRVGSSTVYKVRYQPVSGALGAPIHTAVTTWRCTNSTCTSTTLIGTQTVSWEPVGDFLSWENAASTASRTQPYSFFNQPNASDTLATTLCSFSDGGWEPNADDAADTAGYAIPYNLKRPTDATDPRGPLFAMGDVVPLDWLNRHKEDVLARLAPNLAVDPLAVPDFRTAAYFQDHEVPGEGFLRLDDESARPIVPYGLTALGWSIRDFYDWFSDCGNKCLDTTNWEAIAALEDPDWSCRRLHLLVITDSQEDCNSVNFCADIANLRNHTGLRSSVIGIGQSPLSSNPLRCIASYGNGTEAYPKTRQQIEQALTDFFNFVSQP